MILFSEICLCNNFFFVMITIKAGKDITVWLKIEEDYGYPKRLVYMMSKETYCQQAFAKSLLQCDKCTNPLA